MVEKRIDVSLISRRHHLRGRLDEVLFFDDGTAGPLDYKFAKDPGRIYTTLRLQSAIYALLIRENFRVPVRRGYLVYTRSQNRVVEITYQPEDFQQDRPGGPRDPRCDPSRQAPSAGSRRPIASIAATDLFASEASRLPNSLRHHDLHPVLAMQAMRKLRPQWPFHVAIIALFRARALAS